MAWELSSFVVESLRRKKGNHIKRSGGETRERKE
jgi:hypothetical protein